MMRKLVPILTILTVLTLACLNSPASASLSVGDRIRFTNQTGSTLGGEFGVHLKNHVNPFAGKTESAELFRTFCLEKNEYIDFHKNGFIIESITDSAEDGGVGGPSPDPISGETAWLFYNFTRGTLYDSNDVLYTSTVAQADDLQRAIWGLEEEIALDLANPFVAAANAASAAEKAAALARTLVLNIVWASDRGKFDGVYEGPKPGTLTAGDRAQSMLYVIPEASTIAVWSLLSVIGVGAAYRKHSQQA